MKYIIIVLLLLSATLNAEMWKDSFALSKGFNKEVICKNGFLMSVFTKSNQILEQQYCYDISSWNSSCKHAPIKCKEKEKIK